MAEAAVSFASAIALELYAFVAYCQVGC